jgi:hypothetical protein
MTLLTHSLGQNALVILNVSNPSRSPILSVKMQITLKAMGRIHYFLLFEMRHPHRSLHPHPTNFIITRVLNKPQSSWPRSVFHAVVQPIPWVVFIEFLQVVIGVPMSKSGHNIALNRWIRSRAVVAEQFQRSKQLLAGPADLPPPLERVSPSTFRKTLTKAPPSRVLSPDSKPTGNVGISISISPARYSRSPSPDKSSMTRQRSQKQKPRKKSAEKRVDEVDVLQVDSAASSTSTPSPPPPPVMRLGGIVRGEKNVFVGEKSEQSVAVDHFGRSNIFSK